MSITLYKKELYAITPDIPIWNNDLTSFFGPCELEILHSKNSATALSHGFCCFQATLSLFFRNNKS